MEVALQMDKLLDEYNKEIQKVTDEAIADVAKESVQKLKGSSPRRSGKYARGWKVSKQGTETIVHNSNYRLTHLLENGHVIKNQYGTYGRVSGQKHIAQVANWANTEIINRIEDKL